MSIPDRLDEKMRLFQHNGRTFREHDELFNDTSWFAVMTGQCPKPDSYDPVAELLDLDETRKRLEQVRAAIATSADYMPKHGEFISKNCAVEPT
jgi:tryptophan halogenase